MDLGGSGFFDRRGIEAAGWDLVLLRVEVKDEEGEGVDEEDEDDED